MSESSPVQSPPVVLVVAAAEAVRTHLNRMLTQCGFAVSLAGSGEKALHTYKQHHAMIALVLVDSQLQDRDSLALFAELQTINPQVRCWFLTDADAAEEDLLHQGVARVVRQPFDMDDLRQGLAGLATEPVACSSHRGPA